MKRGHCNPVTQGGKHRASQGTGGALTQTGAVREGFLQWGEPRGAEATNAGHADRAGKGYQPECWGTSGSGHRGGVESGGGG